MTSRSLLEIEGENNHLGMRLADRLSVGNHVFVTQLVDMVLVQAVGQAIEELQFGSQLEEGEIEIASRSYLDEEVRPFEFEVIVLFVAEVNHGIDAGNHVGTMVIKPRPGKDEVHGGGEIGGLHVLFLLAYLALRVHIIIIMERDVARAKVHGGGNTQLEMGVEAQLAEHSHLESRIPAVLVGGDERFDSGAIVGNSRCGADVEELNILQVCPDKDAEMEFPQISIRAVLHRPILCLAHVKRQAQHHDERPKTHHLIIITQIYTSYYKGGALLRIILNYEKKYT